MINHKEEVSVVKPVSKPVLPVKPVVKPKKLPTLLKPDKNPNKNGSNGYLFWKLLSLGFLLVLLLGVITINNLDFNESNNVNQETFNNYSINNSVQIPYYQDVENRFDNNFEINLDIDEELINKFCNSS